MREQSNEFVRFFLQIPSEAVRVSAAYRYTADLTTLLLERSMRIRSEYLCDRSILVAVG